MSPRQGMCKIVCATCRQVAHEHLGGMEAPPGTCSCINESYKDLYSKETPGHRILGCVFTQRGLPCETELLVTD